MGEKHVTEIRCPEQTAGFRDIIEQMYRVHLDKNADYSPANILGTGEIGLIVRLWDKMARLFSLSGFEIEVKFVGMKEKREPKNESLDDTLLDMAVYAIIALLYRRGKWGK